MITILCSTKSCALRPKCRVVNSSGSMTPLLKAELSGKVTFRCRSERITHKKKRSGQIVSLSSVYPPVVPTDDAV